MKILFNNAIFFSQKIGGVSRYFDSIFKKFIELKFPFKVIAPIYKNIYLKDLDNRFKQGLYFPKYPMLKQFVKLNEILTNFIISKNYKSNIIHDTYCSSSLLEIKNKKKVITIYDLIHEKFNNYYNYKDIIQNKKKIFDNTDYFICISNKTKEDFLDLYKVPEYKVEVTHLGCDHMNEINKNDTLLNIDNFKKKYEMDKPFILYVGRRSKYKNFISLMNSYYNCKKINQNFDIVCFGGEEFSKEEIGDFKKLKISKNLHYFSGSDSDLKQFYVNASVMVATSKYEGFGLPLVEAMSLQCKLLINDIQIFREICGNNAIYFESEEDLKIKLENILFSSQNIKNLNQIKIDTIKKYSWMNTAKKTIKIYNLLQN